jgi:hypothetical protein
MKQLILILISCLAFAQEPQKPDTSIISPELKAAIVSVEAEMQKSEILDGKWNEVNKESKKLETRLSRLQQLVLRFYKTYFSSGNEKNDSTDKDKAIKEENRNDPVKEIDVYDGSDTIRGGFFYRLFHKDDIIIRRYKIENNEKVYLD